MRQGRLSRLVRLVHSCILDACSEELGLAIDFIE